MPDVRLIDANVLTRWLEAVLSNANPLDRKARADFSEVLARVKTCLKSTLRLWCGAAGASTMKMTAVTVITGKLPDESMIIAHEARRLTELGNRDIP